LSPDTMVNTSGNMNLLHLVEIMNPSFPDIVDIAAYILVPVLCCLFGAKGILHYFQLESYQFPGYFRTLGRNKKHALLPGIVAVVFVVIIRLGGYFANQLLYGAGLYHGVTRIIVDVLMMVLAALAGVFISKLFTEKKAKKPFVITGRVKRLYVVLFIVMTLVSVAEYFLVRMTILAGFRLSLWPLLLPLVVALAGLLAWPIEKLISECYFRDARRKLLASKDLIRIGITGSYGKTSVKHVLGTILSEKFTTLITPASFNTPMGVSRTIREKLTPSYQVFVGEMGARHVGDIKEMCRLVKPVIGVITSVGPQHLETFKTIQRVAKTKYELIQALPEDGRSYFYDDGSFCKEMYENTTIDKTLCGTDETTSDVWYSDVSVSQSGCSFILHIRDKGSIPCQTRLLGQHNISNIMLAAAVANDLGLSLRQIARGIEKLQPVKNRLELMTNPGGFTIINDAFNSNPVGAKAALDVLSQFPQRRIIITPGMVELGNDEEKYNREFGKQIAGAADIAIIIGKNRATPILEGLREGGFAEENMYRVDSLDDSTRLLHTIVKPTDTVLYENDLPDHYQEA